jgi:hypothetical protein
MPYERARFGDGSVAGAGNVVLTVSQHFGQRNERDEESAGIVNTQGVYNELTIDFDAATLSAGAFNLTPAAIPAGSRVIRVLVEVQAAFSLGGTTPAVRIGTLGSAPTNGFTISEAQAEAVGMYDVTASVNGTWANQLAARTVVGIALTGTTPTNGTVGRARVIIEYARF